MRVVGDLGVPVAFGLRSGHVSRANITLPIGVRARLEVGSEVKLKILEPATDKAIERSSKMKTNSKHIHLIGICGTAMASLAGMLRERGLRVTGSDAAAYPPMSTFLNRLGIPVAQPFAEANLDPRPDLVVVGNAMSRGNVELEYVLDQRIPFCSLPQILARRISRRERSAGRRWNARQDHDDLNARLDFRIRRTRALVPDRRHRREFRQQLPPRRRASTSSSKATSTTPHSSIRARSSSTIFPTPSFSPRSSSITPISTKISMRSKPHSSAW